MICAYAFEGGEASSPGAGMSFSLMKENCEAKRVGP
jgi:hypothetical protein